MKLKPNEPQDSNTMENAMRGLPPGWGMQKSATEGKYFYVDLVTKASTWKKPEKASPGYLKMCLKSKRVATTYQDYYPPKLTNRGDDLVKARSRLTSGIRGSWRGYADPNCPHRTFATASSEAYKKPPVDPNCDIMIHHKVRTKQLLPEPEKREFSAQTTNTEFFKGLQPEPGSVRPTIQRMAVAIPKGAPLQTETTNMALYKCHSTQVRSKNFKPPSKRVFSSGVTATTHYASHFQPIITSTRDLTKYCRQRNNKPTHERGRLFKETRDFITSSEFAATQAMVGHNTASRQHCLNHSWRMPENGWELTDNSVAT